MRTDVVSRKDISQKKFDEVCEKKKAVSEQISVLMYAFDDRHKCVTALLDRQDRYIKVIPWMQTYKYRVGEDRRWSSTDREKSHEREFRWTVCHSRSLDAATSKHMTWLWEFTGKAWQQSVRLDVHKMEEVVLLTRGCRSLFNGSLDRSSSALARDVRGSCKSCCLQSQGVRRSRVTNQFYRCWTLIHERDDYCTRCWSKIDKTRIKGVRHAYQVDWLSGVQFIDMGFVSLGCKKSVTIMMVDCHNKLDKLLVMWSKWLVLDF